MVKHRPYNINTNEILTFDIPETYFAYMREHLKRYAILFQ